MHFPILTEHELHERKLTGTEAGLSSSKKQRKPVLLRIMQKKHLPITILHVPIKGYTLKTL